MLSRLRDPHGPLINDPSLQPIPCVICGTMTPLGQCHSIAVVYVGRDGAGQWRHTVCDADQPIACCQEHAVQAVLAYHTTRHAQVLAGWAGDPIITYADHTTVLPFPTETVCHGCGTARDDTHIVALVDYRLTSHHAIRGGYCPHVLCPVCLPAAIAVCAQDHLLTMHHHRKATAIAQGRMKG